MGSFLFIQERRKGLGYSYYAKKYHHANDNKQERNDNDDYHSFISNSFLVLAVSSGK